MNVAHKFFCIALTRALMAAGCSDDSPNSPADCHGKCTDQQVCVEGKCQNKPPPDLCEKCGGTTCPDLSSDAHHCGKCNHPCDETSECVAG